MVMELWEEMEKRLGRPATPVVDKSRLVISSQSSTTEVMELGRKPFCKSRLIKKKRFKNDFYVSMLSHKTAATLFLFIQSCRSPAKTRYLFGGGKAWQSRSCCRCCWRATLMYFVHLHCEREHLRSKVNCTWLWRPRRQRPSVEFVFLRRREPSVEKALQVKR